MTSAASPLLHAAAAVLCLAWAALMLLSRRGSAPLLAACAAMASAWAVAVAMHQQTPLEGLPGLFEVLRGATCFVVLLLLCRQWAGVGALAWRLAGLGLAITALALLALLPGLAEWTLPGLGSPLLLPRLGLALLVVLMAENLYRNADETARWHIVLPCIALGGLGGFDLVLYGHAVLTRALSPVLLDARAVLTALAMPLLAVAALRDRRRLVREPPVSRHFVFHGATLMVVGTFLLGIAAASEALRQFAAPWSHTAQAALVAGAMMALLVGLSAVSLRSRLRRLLVDHFFSARYDYRHEWLRCVATLAAPEAEMAADRRAIRALADPVDSPAGMLLLRGNGEAMQWAGSWNAPAAQLNAAEQEVLAHLLRDDAVASDALEPGLGRILPGAWLLAPLHHPREGLMGCVLLARPRAAFIVDDEVFELLRTLGREVAMFLAERRAAEQLADQAGLQAYAGRFAFVAHDVKNVASQLTLLLANAQDNIAYPEFQQDMLLTVGAAADRIKTLIARLQAPQTTPPQHARAHAGFAPLPRLQRLAARQQHRVMVDDEAGAAVLVTMPPEDFDTAIVHLLDNAVEASPPSLPVRLRLLREGGALALQIIDHGKGMDAAFMRDVLFRPLASGKPRGCGIGAWQAQQLLRQSGGELEVQSAPGQGTTMRLLLPWVPPPTAKPALPAMSDMQAWP
jgi:putative PEP-CTERM system histidine kinase